MPLDSDAHRRCGTLCRGPEHLGVAAGGHLDREQSRRHGLAHLPRRRGRLADGSGCAGAAGTSPAAEVEVLGVLEQDLLVEALQWLSGLDPQLVDEQASGLLVDLERVCLAAAAVERQHERGAHALAQRMLARERLELGNERGVDAQLELGVDALFERGEPQLLEPHDLGLREQLVLDVDERAAAPERERRAQELRALGRRSRRGAAHELLESVDVRLAGREPEQITGTRGLDPLRTEQPA